MSGCAAVIAEHFGLGASCDDPLPEELDVPLSPVHDPEYEQLGQPDGKADQKADGMPPEPLCTVNQCWHGVCACNGLASSPVMEIVFCSKTLPACGQCIAKCADNVNQALHDCSSTVKLCC